MSFEARPASNVKVAYVCLDALSYRRNRQNETTFLLNRAPFRLSKLSGFAAAIGCAPSSSILAAHVCRDEPGDADQECNPGRKYHTLWHFEQLIQYVLFDCRQQREQ